VRYDTRYIVPKACVQGMPLRAYSFSACRIARSARRDLPTMREHDVDSSAVLGSCCCLLFCYYANSISRRDSREIEYDLSPYCESVDHTEHWRRFYEQPEFRSDFADVPRFL
jgi:hypothetical protein